MAAELIYILFLARDSGPCNLDGTSPAFSSALADPRDPLKSVMAHFKRLFYWFPRPKYYILNHGCHLFDIYFNSSKKLK
jgi:hypothetical protein